MKIFKKRKKHIPNFAHRSRLNKRNFNEKEQKKVRNWYLKAFPEKCEQITDFTSNWIGNEFGVSYYTGGTSRIFYRLCLGNNWFVQLPTTYK